MNPKVLFYVFGQALKEFCHSGGIIIIVFINVSALMSRIKCLPLGHLCFFVFERAVLTLCSFLNWVVNLLQLICQSYVSLLSIMFCKYLKNTVIYSVAFKAPAFSWKLGPLAAPGKSGGRWRVVEGGRGAQERLCSPLGSVAWLFYGFWNWISHCKLWLCFGWGFPPIP